MPGSTSLDVHKKTFTRAMRGYAIDEVDAFLDEVAAEMTRLKKANGHPHERPIGRTDEEAIAKAIVTAQRVAEQTLAEAEAEAQAVIMDARDTATEAIEAAQLQAREIIDAAEQHARKVGDELTLRQQELEEAIRALQSFEGGYRDRLRECVADLMTTLEATTPSGPVAPPAPPGLMPAKG